MGTMLIAMDKIHIIYDESEEDFMYRQGPTCPTCPCKYEPIVMPVRECVCNRYFCVEQPVICPVNTRIVNHFVPKPVYYPSYTQTEENICEGTAQTGMNNGTTYANGPTMTGR